MSRARDISNQGAGTYGSITADDLTVDTSTLVVDDANNRVGIGTASPTNSLHVYGGSNTQFKVESSGAEANMTLTGGSYAQINNSTGDLYITNNNSTNMIFRTASTERMRLDTSGRLKFGTDTVSSAMLFYDDNDPCFRTYVGSASYRNHFQFKNDNGTVGSISTTGSATSFNTSSDYRLKENVVDMTGSIERVKQLKPSQFNFIADPDKTVDGFLAHEVSDVVPEAITGVKDGMRTEEYEITPAVYDENGWVVTEAVTGEREVPAYQSIDQSKLVPLLTAALQEAIGRIETLEAEVTALKGV